MPYRPRSLYKTKYTGKQKWQLFRKHIKTKLEIPTTQAVKDMVTFHKVEKLVQALPDGKYVSYSRVLCKHLQVRVGLHFATAFKSSSSEKQYEFMQVVNFARALLIYLPQGTKFQEPTDILKTRDEHDINGTIYDHPEWVMGEKYFHFTACDQTSVTLNSKLKRNLASGDRIVLVVEVGCPGTLIANYSGNIDVDVEYTFASKSG